MQPSTPFLTVEEICLTEETWYVYLISEYNIVYVVIFETAKIMKIQSIRI